MYLLRNDQNTYFEMVLPSLLSTTSACLQAASIFTNAVQIPIRLCIYSALTQQPSTGKSNAQELMGDIFNKIETFIGATEPRAGVVAPSTEFMQRIMQTVRQF